MHLAIARWRAAWCVMRNDPAVLSEQRIWQIVHQLDQKCQMVEFEIRSTSRN
jgi:hypothetical protein